MLFSSLKELFVKKLHNQAKALQCAFHETNYTLFPVIFAIVTVLKRVLSMSAQVALCCKIHLHGGKVFG